jgi:putative ABC transport system permease protein
MSVLSSRWRPALRMARRDLWRHKGRTLLTMFLVALPVLVGVAVAEFHHNTQWEGERAARSTMGGADALVEVTPFTKTRVSYWPEGMNARPGSFATGEDGKRRPVRRDRATVDLAALLPAGSRVIAALEHHQVALASGGVGQVKVLDAFDPMAQGLASVSAGVAPRQAGEVAVNETAADELGLLDVDGEPLPDARVRLLDGTALRVVGVMEYDTDTGYGDGIEMLAAPGSIAADPAHSRSSEGSSHRYLVDLPDSVGSAPHALASSLKAHGVALLPRDVMFHPAAWRVRAPAPGPVNPASLAIGALAVLFGLIEVVLIVGSAFAVGARRQVRDLGLVAASGGAPADVRRVLLAQGLVLGVAASVLGAVAGVLAFRLGTPLYEQLRHRPIWTQDIDWLAVVGVTLLGSLTGLAAAFVPALSIGRLTPVAALSGRFPIRPGESRAHRPAFVLAGCGLVVLLLSGWWTAVEYTPPVQPPNGPEVFSSASPVPVVIGVLGLLMLIGGVVWAAPYAVRKVAARGRLLPLSGRFAFRDAARHRFRSAAAAVTLTVTVAGAVFAAFAVQAVAATIGGSTDQRGAQHKMSVYLDEYSPVDAPAADRIEKVIATIHDVIGPAEALAASRVARAGRDFSELGVRGRHGYYLPVRMIDERTLQRLVGSNPAALKAFRAGAVVTTVRRSVHDGNITVSLSPGRHKPDYRWRLPATVVRSAGQLAGSDLSGAWVSAQTVRRMGLLGVPSSVTVFADRAVTSEDMTRLAVHGINGWSGDVDLEPLAMIRLGVTGTAGLLTLLVVGMAVALSAAEGRADQSTMAAVGAGPWRRRSLGGMHGLFLGLVGVLLGVFVGVPAGAALLQVDGAPGVAVPWLGVGSVLLVVPLLAWLAGWLVTSTRLTLVRRTG